MDRLSGRAAVLLLLVPLTFTGKALLTGRSYAPFDLAYHSEPLLGMSGKYGVGPGRGIFFDVHSAIIPWHQAVRWAWSHGEWPLLDPFLRCGDPLAGSAQPAPYAPVNLLMLALPPPLGLTFAASLQLFLAALAAFLWTRDLGCREEAAADPLDRVFEEVRRGEGSLFCTRCTGPTSDTLSSKGESPCACDEPRSWP